MAPGFWLAIGYAIAGVINLIFIITISFAFAFASWRLAGYALWPLGRVVIRKPQAGAPSVVGM